MDRSKQIIDLVTGEQARRSKDAATIKSQQQTIADLRNQLAAANSADTLNADAGAAIDAEIASLAAANAADQDGANATPPADGTNAPPAAN